MKLASLLAGAAVVALTAGAASAQEINTFSRGQWTTGFGLPTTNLVISNTRNVPSNSGGTNAANTVRANDADNAASAWHASGISVGNVGGIAASDGATFSLEGNVNEDCAFYTGTSNSLSFDFGTLGIYASDNTGAAAAFTMVAPAALNFDTNLAGCNTANSVTIEKTGANPALGMVNGSAGGYDTAVFQANLEYNITARYTATTGATPGVGELQTLVVGDTAVSNTRDHGAWKSNMDIEVVVPVADKALVAGDYAGSFTVTVATI